MKIEGEAVKDGSVFIIKTTSGQYLKTNNAGVLTFVSQSELPSNYKLDHSFIFHI